jgi:ribosomal-protein-alanine N-acetyltransferase
MTIDTPRLIIRPFVNSDPSPFIRRILDQEFGVAGSDGAALKDLRSWLEWQMLNHEWFEKMRQPPYGDQAITLKTDGQIIGVVGYVPCLAPFEQIPELRGVSRPSGLYSTEFGLFYAIAPEYQKQGYATEAARGMIEYAFTQLHIRRVIAMTDYTNQASQNVMRNLRMKITRNPLSEPRWLQIVGVVENRGE